MAIYEHEHDPQCMIIDLHLAEQCEYSEPDVVVVVHPNDDGVSPRYDEPLSYVEFGVVDQQRPLDVFLQHFSVVLAASRVGIHYIIVVS